MRNLLEHGDSKSDRTGTGTLSIFGHQIRVDLQKEFPLLTSKAVHWPSIAHELIWFMNGDTNIKYLTDNKVRIWNEWADENGDLGPVYGKQWRKWQGVRRAPGINVPITIDQLSAAIQTLRNNPTDRGIIVSAWNVADLPDMALRPCHTMFQFHTTEMTDLERMEWVANNPSFAKIRFVDYDVCGVPKYKLSCQLYQRSADWFLGVPFNTASYSLLTLIVAKAVNMIPHHFVHTFGDTHLYNNHIDPALKQLSRQAEILPAPNVVVNTSRNDCSALRVKFEDLILNRYQHLGPIAAMVSV